GALKRNLTWKIKGNAVVLKADNEYPLAVLGNTVVLTVEDFCADIIPQVGKYILHHLPGAAVIVVGKPFYIFINEYFGLGFPDNTGKIVKKRTPDIFEPQALAHHGERLAGASADQQIHLPPVGS